MIILIIECTLVNYHKYLVIIINLNYSILIISIIVGYCYLLIDLYNLIPLI